MIVHFPLPRVSPKRRRGASEEIKRANWKSTDLLTPRCLLDYCIVTDCCRAYKANYHKSIQLLKDTTLSGKVVFDLGKVYLR
ncbi:hypothetical protein JTE90_016915 [Oedothorax gibbosus]|uniref:Uncharacterized protein n=1 Tax=Oedothorax gibbosus TaxID=931172 RepID=A0AAV6UU79_9ARAC|nr:hypothetical protein JTE90_016915 [Oedothorax gibbosus]